MGGIGGRVCVCMHKMYVAGIYTVIQIGQSIGQSNRTL